MKLNSRLRWSKIETPVTSLGSRSGVHCRRLNSSPRETARARASIVLPTPGTSSKRIWPSQSRAIKRHLHHVPFADNHPLDVVGDFVGKLLDW
jgi:hypothetical protein